MGNTASQEPEEIDPWWQSSRSQQTSNQNVLPQTEEDTLTWQQRELTLGQTIQHLAEENMRLFMAQQTAEKHAEDAQVETQEMDRLRSEAEKTQQVFEKLHTQIQAGREDRQMITSEMERIRTGFDAEREAKEELMLEMRQLREENRSSVEALKMQLIKERKLTEEAKTHLSEEKENFIRESDRLRQELKVKNIILLNREKELERLSEELRTSDIAKNSSPVRVRSPEVKAEMERFQEEMNSRRAARQRALHAVSSELEHLRVELSAEREARLRDETVMKELEQKTSADKKRLRQLSQENERLQSELAESADKLEPIQNQVTALKEVVTITKQMLAIREGQVQQLKDKINQIETSVVGLTHVDLKAEYEAQIQNIRSLKDLYEERMHVLETEKEAELSKSAELEQQLEELKLSLSHKEEKISDLQIQLDDSHDKSKGLANELTHINSMFTQMLVGDKDLDKLTRLLQENHDLITEITIKEDCSEAAATLPKLLLDLVTQIEREVNPSEECSNGMAAHDIALNLPKVWKVLMELLSHHVAPTLPGEPEEDDTSCYNTVDTPSGPHLMISVSKTFLRLKDLILEKKSLQKELTRLKQLNGHLEIKLNDQEHKLSLVSGELHKTWGVVDRMQTQHQQLHTHEKILRYELHEKRKMLTELKQELEYCREKWERARQKNSESELEWKKLRKEFASRKQQPEADLLNNSGESGFSEEQGDDSGTEDAGIMCTSPPLVIEFPAADNPASPGNEQGDGYNMELQEHVPDCSTISLITLLKQQLAFFSRNLNTTALDGDNMSRHNQQALESIFSLPPIQIPNEIDESPNKQNCLQSFYCCGQGTSLGFRASTPEKSPPFKSDNTVDMGGTDNTHCLAEDVEGTSVTVVSSCESSSPDQQDQATAMPDAATGSEKSTQDCSKVNRTPEEIAEARAARLKRLEEQCQQLFNKVTRTTHRSNALYNRLEELHEQYKSSDSPVGSRTDSEQNSSSNSRSISQASVSTTSVIPSLPITESDTIPPPPPFPHNLPTRRLPSSLESTDNAIPATQVSEERLSSCPVESQTSITTTEIINESTTRRTPNTTQDEEESTECNSSSHATNKSDQKS